MKTPKVIPIVADDVGTMLEHMAALSDPIRCRMTLALERHELTVSELCSVLQLPQSTVSRHLKTLGDDGWVTSRRDGTSRYYSMSIDDLDTTARRLWTVIRERVSTTAVADHDERRLRSVLARRQSKSQEFFSTASGRWDHLREELFGRAFHLHAFLALLDPTMTVGDLGCGTGQIAAALAPYVSRVIGVDGSAAMLRVARARLKDVASAEFRLGSLEALPVDEAALDTAVMALVLHHVPEPGRCLAECARVLKPGGRALIVDMLPHDRAEYQQQMGHVWLGFSEKQIRKLLIAEGFADVRVHALPVDTDAKGPALFAAVATRL